LDKKGCPWLSCPAGKTAYIALQASRNNFLSLEDGFDLSNYQPTEVKLLVRDKIRK
jgi:hypothetical protein